MKPLEELTEGARRLLGSVRALFSRAGDLPRGVRAGLLGAVAAAVLLAPPLETIRISAVLSIGRIGAFAILAIGIVMIYRASKVLNLAHGAMVMFPPYVVWVLSRGGAPLPQRVWACAIPAVCVGPLLASLLQKRLPRRVRLLIAIPASAATLVALTFVAGAGVPVPFAVAVGLTAGGALGYLVERVFVRALRAQGPTAQTVGTVAALGLMVAISAKIFGTAAERPIFIFPDQVVKVSESSIRYGEIGLFVIAMVLTAALIALFKKTDIGLIMRGTAENRRAASLMGIDPDRITAITWVLGGLLAALSGILLASVTNLHPYTLSLQALPAFVAALLGGMGSLLGAVAGAAIVAGTLSIFPGLGPLQRVQGAPELFLAIAAVVAMATRGQRIVGGDVRSESVAAATASAPQGLGGLARGKRPLGVLGVTLFLLFPFLPFIRDSIVSKAALGAGYTMIAVSLVILIGWVGQISLGHAALVGVGAYSTGWITGGFDIPFPLSVPLAAAAAAAVAAVLGVVAVRVRGLFLAVATLIFSWMGSEFLFRQQWFIKHFKIDPATIGTEGLFPYFDFSEPRTMFYVGWALAMLCLIAAANLRDSKTGRAFFAVQGSEMAAASLGVDVTRYKLLAFATSGFIAGAAGSLMMTRSLVASPEQFGFDVSLLFVAFAVVGGLRSLGGAVTAGLLFALLDELFFRVQALSGYLPIFSAALLAIVLLAYPTGIAGLGTKLAQLLGRSRRISRALTKADHAIDVFLSDVSWAKERIAQRLRERLEAPALEALPALAVAAPAAGTGTNGHRAETPDLAGYDGDLLSSSNGVARAPAANGSAPAPAARGAALAGARPDRPLVVRSESVTVRFGGLTAVDDVTLEVREGEIVGLIGPNGAGKTVSFNSIAGIVRPTEGRVFLYGQDVTEAPVHERARLGIARTFQVLQLFPALTVFENLLVATHLHNETGILSHISATPPSIDAEREARARVREVVDLLGLGEVVEKYPGDLPFGTLRLVEVARALVTGLKFVMLDEAFSGLDDAETESLVQTLLKIRDLGITILLIEHDVKLVMSVSDYVYVLDRGRLIAEGLPATVQRDPAVIAAYLGRAPDDEPASVEVGS